MLYSIQKQAGSTERKLQGVDPSAKPFMPGSYAAFAEMHKQEEKHTMPQDIYSQFNRTNHAGPQPTLAHHPTSQLTANARNVNGAAAQAAALVAARAAEQERSRQEEDYRRHMYETEIAQKQQANMRERAIAIEQQRRIEAATSERARYEKEVQARDKALQARAAYSAYSQGGLPPAHHGGHERAPPMKPGNYDYLKQYNDDFAKQQHERTQNAYGGYGVGIPGMSNPYERSSSAIERQQLERNAIERMQRAHDQARARGTGQPGVPQRVGLPQRPLPRGGYPPNF